LHQAGSLVAVGRREEALSLIDRALPRLQETMGSSSPMFQRIVRLRDEIANQKRPSANTSRHGIFM
ncbi:MAG: hypothetical protein ACOVN2_11460, partial [Usitatibacteraceae bacterium]